MIEDTVISEFRLGQINSEMVVSSEDGETAYSLHTINHGKAMTLKEEEEILSKISIAGNTLGFKSDMECDLSPYCLITYNADKSENAKYTYGDHAPGKVEYQSECRFKPGEKVLCLCMKDMMWSFREL